MNSAAVELIIYLPLTVLAVLEVFWWTRFLVRERPVPRAAWAVGAGALAFAVIGCVLAISRLSAIFLPGSLESVRQGLRIALAVSAYTGLIALRQWRSRRGTG